MFRSESRGPGARMSYSSSCPCMEPSPALTSRDGRCAARCALWGNPSYRSRAGTGRRLTGRPRPVVGIPVARVRLTTPGSIRRRRSRSVGRRALGWPTANREVRVSTSSLLPVPFHPGTRGISCCHLEVGSRRERTAGLVDEREATRRGGRLRRVETVRADPRVTRARTSQSRESSALVCGSSSAVPDDTEYPSRRRWQRHRQPNSSSSLCMMKTIAFPAPRFT